MRTNLHRSHRKVLEPLPGRRPVVARNLPFEDRRHASTSRIDFLTVRGNSGRALTLNALFDEWRARKVGEPIEDTLIAFGTIDWLFHEYKQTKGYLEKVSKRSRRDYERTMRLITDLVTKKGDRVGGP